MQRQQSKIAGEVIEEMRDCGSFAHEMMARSQTKPNQETHEYKRRKKKNNHTKQQI